MLKQLFRDAVVYTFGRIASAVFGLALLPFYTRQLDPAEYGLWDISYLAASLTAMMVAVEISQAAARYYCGTDDSAQRKVYLSTALTFTLAAFAVFSGLAVALSPWIAEPILGPRANPMTLVLVVASAAAMGILKLSQGQLRWMMRPWAFFLTTMVQLSLTAGLSVSLVLMGWGAEGLLLGLLLGNCAAAALGLVMGRASIGIAWSRQHLSQMLRFSVPLVLSSSAVFVSAYIDRVAVKELMSMAELGLYAVAYRFAAAIDLIMAGFSAALMPLIYSKHEEAKTPGHLAALLRRMLWVGAVVVLGLAVFSHDLIYLFADREYASSAGLIALLALAVFLTKLQNVTPGLWIAEKTRLLAALNVISAVLNVALNVLLIPILGVYGAALATIASAGFAYLINVIASQRHYPIRLNWLRMGMTAAVTGALLLVLHDWIATLPVFTLQGLATKAAVAIGCALALALLTLEAGDRRAIIELVSGRLRRSPTD